jgi:hypothetical protein
MWAVQVVQAVAVDLTGCNLVQEDQVQVERPLLVKEVMVAQDLHQLQVQTQQAVAVAVQVLLAEAQL